MCVTRTLSIVHSYPHTFMYHSRIYEHELHRKDKKMYVACYKELAEKLPGPPTALLLGDAYMKIQEV